ncbi:MAG: mevalonate kinase [Saprospiraceae bacterium]
MSLNLQLGTIPSKVLLFGEYTILQGSDALAIPNFDLYTFWKDNGDKKKQLNLSDFAAFLAQTSLPFSLDLAAFNNDLKNGWYLHSNIPTGYGLGSSGAVVAAIVEKYGSNYEGLDLEVLHQSLAKMEGFFHGASSGIDPLVCLLKKPVLIKNGGQIEVLNSFIEKSHLPNTFLLDSKQSRKTGPLVAHFKEMAEKPGFQSMLKVGLIPAQNRAITTFLNGEMKSFWQALESISSLQFEFFQKMILKEQLEYWKEGLENKNYFLKLCGAGGGGFLLAFSKEETLTSPFPARKINFDFSPFK